MDWPLYKHTFAMGKLEVFAQIFFDILFHRDDFSFNKKFHKGSLDTTHELISGIRYYLESCTVSANIEGQDYSYAMIQGGCTSQPNYAQVQLYQDDDDLAIFDEHIAVSYRSFQFRRKLLPK